MSPSSAATRLRGAGRRVTGLPSRTPLRVQLVVAILLLGALAMVLFGFAGTARLRSNLEANLDGRLTSFAASTVGPNGPRYFEDSGGRGGAESSSTWSALVDSSGHWLDPDSFTRVVSASPGFVGSPAITSQKQPGLGVVIESYASAHTAPFTVSAAGTGARWRVLLLPVSYPTSGGKAQGTLIVALTQESVDGPVSALVRIDLILGAGVLLLLGLAAWLVVRFSLRPLTGVEHTAAAIAAGDLSRRVPVASDRTEVGRLGAALNAMLGHIESAFAAQSRSEAAALTTAEQMRRFAADASHELRTPLTSIRGFAELSRSGVIPPGPETDRAMERIESESIRMTGLVEDLLLLARLDQQRPLEHRPVDLLELAADAVHDAAVISPDHPTSLEGPDAEDGATAAVVLGDEPRLRQVVTNLVANALHHTPHGTHVVVRVGTVGATAHLDVVDDGPGLDEADAARVFERFYRTDSSRTRSAGAGGGSGLGLSIVAALVHAHGGSVDLHTTPGAGATFGVVLPLAAARPPGTPALAATPTRPGTAPPASATGPAIPEGHPALTR